MTIAYGLQADVGDWVMEVEFREGRYCVMLSDLEVDALRYESVEAAEAVGKRLPPFLGLRVVGLAG